MSDEKRISTRKAARLAGDISTTHFRRLAQQTPQVVPFRIDGMQGDGWTIEQVNAIKARLKR